MDVGKLAKDAGYVFLGMAIINFQRAQVRRRELETQLSSAADHLGTVLPPPVRDLLAKK